MWQYNRIDYNYSALVGSSSKRNGDDTRELLSGNEGKRGKSMGRRDPTTVGIRSEWIRSELRLERKGEEIRTLGCSSR